MIITKPTPQGPGSVTYMKKPHQPPATQTQNVYAAVGVSGHIDTGMYAILAYRIYTKGIPSTRPLTTPHTGGTTRKQVQHQGLNNLALTFKYAVEFSRFGRT
ncbi:hypothetical protein, partial [Antricoccus suffuscus]|uniref:hypothetical protein n=1 Tax=Antricoccus suffuscus TaxID=1629062 RepID=UPI001EE0D5AD